MKRWIHASTEISAEILWKAQEFAKRFKGAKVDLENNEIVIPFDKNATENATEDEIFNELGLGTWFKDNGFDVQLERKDVEYTTKGEWLNYRGWQRSKGHPAMLRDRLVLTARW